MLAQLLTVLLRQSLSSSGSKPVVSGNTVYVCSGDNSLHALDIKTGKEKWHTDRFSMSSNIFTPVTIDENTAYFANTSEELYAVDKRNGKERWHVSGYGAEGNSNPDALNGVVYIGNNGKLCALNANNGSLKWEYDLSNNK
ncbi:MAG: PQQ-like beta-propeller repeat protein [Rubrobacteridae bacterium]|nr:PQQ-like beta-propeller repeat protein [Rubrobacteridae bacterium]